MVSPAAPTMTFQQPTSRLRPFRPVPFGRYTLLLPLSTGGMGEIFLARMEGPQGFEKLCVIKKILPHLATEPDFVERFVHEAKTLVHLSHGSIAQVLDMGLEQEEPFLALEYVDGKDLRKVAARLRDRGTTLPLSVTLYVLSRVLDALAYAHRKRDADEREIRLVHRDISPQNVLVSYEGEVKVIDFGLAKSTLTAATTNPSIVLGKFLYMSPEQARHQPVDRRSDLYSVGLCLYELISGKNPFEAVAPNELITRVANPHFARLETVAPRCPPALAELVTRALAVEVEDRFQTAEEFRAKLSACLHELDPAAGPENVSRFMRETFAVEYHTERRMLASLRDSLRTEAEKASAAASNPNQETAVFNLKALGFEDPFFESAAPPPGRPASDLRPTKEHGAIKDEATLEEAVPEPPSPWLTATDPNLAPYEPPSPPQEMPALPTPAQPLAAAPTMPFPRPDFVPDGLGTPPVRKGPLPARTEARPVPVTIPDPEPAPERPPATATTELSFLASPAPSAWRRRGWRVAIPFIGLLLAGVAYLGFTGELRPGERNAHRRPSSATSIPAEPSPGAPSDEARAAPPAKGSRGKQGGHPDDAELLAPLTPSADAPGGSSVFPRISHSPPHRSAALVKEWGRTRMAFSHLVRQRPCASEGMSPLCLRYSQLSHDLAEGAGTQTDEQLLVRVRDLRRQMDAKAP